jgi:hypothetical protein
MKFCKVCGYPENAHPYRHPFQPDEFRRGPSTGRIDCSKPNETNVPKEEPEREDTNGHE